ncbi:MAG TPA: hypothetical protein VH877_09980, partial [Polyangia bacterium]|nr:hypothetical protein [Polyangia bacterium]
MRKLNSVSRRIAWTAAALALSLLAACGEPGPAVKGDTGVRGSQSVVLTEGFESGTKTSYADATVTLSSGVWDMNDCLIGNLSTDVKSGTAAARCRNSGTLTMQFDLTSGAGTFTVSHAKFSSDASSTWALYYSTNGGTTWTQTGSTVTTSTTTLATATFTVNVSGTVRFQIRKTDGSVNRIDFDNISITDYGTSGGGTVGPGGGTLSTLSFAIVGDTRPSTINDTAGYPTAIITKIYQDLQAFTPRPAFAVATGDYMYASTTGTQQGPQLDLYLQARANFSNVLFPALGNHECTGYTTSNCGTGNTDGNTLNYTTYLSKMLGPINQTLPYYTINVNAIDGSWTSKFVFIAANAWDSTQSSWLS